MSKRAASSSDSRKRARKGTYTVVGYDRAKGGLQAGARSKLVAAMKRAAGGEKKGMDTAIAISTPVLATTNTNGDCFVLNLLQQGAGSWNRIGRKASLLSLRLRGTFSWRYTPQAVTGNVPGNTVRMVVVWDKQPSSSTIPVFNDIFGKTDQQGTESTTFLDPVKYDNMERYAVLRDCVVPFTPQFFNSAGLAANTSTVEVAFDEFIKLGGRETVFSGTTDPLTLASVSTGALYVYFRARLASDEANDVTVTEMSFARLRYIDA